MNFPEDYACGWVLFSQMVILLPARILREIGSSVLCACVNKKENCCWRGKKRTQPLPGLISRTANGSGEKHYRKFTAQESQLGFQTIISCKSEVESSASRKISVGDWALKIQVVFNHFTFFLLRALPITAHWRDVLLMHPAGALGIPPRERVGSFLASAQFACDGGIIPNV